MLLVAAFGALGQACSPDTTRWAAIQPGPASAGAARVTMNLPIAGPIAGHVDRASVLWAVDDAQVVDGTLPSSGVWVPPRITAVWLDNESESVLLVKADTFGASETLAAAAQVAVEEASGRDLAGRVIVVSSHTHAGHGGLRDQTHWAPWTGSYNHERLTRLIEQTEEVAVDAWRARQPVHIGASITLEWNDGVAILDPRSENDGIALWPDYVSGVGGPMHVLRIDDLDGDPILAMVTAGIDNDSLGPENTLVSGEVSGIFERALDNMIGPDAIAMHLPGASTDSAVAAPGPVGADAVGYQLADRAYVAWSDTPTGRDPIRLEAVTRHAWQYLDEVVVLRSGDVHMHYEEPRPRGADGIVYTESGAITSPLEEFATLSGALCEPTLADLGPALATDAVPYVQCIDAGQFARSVNELWGMDHTEEQILNEAAKAGVGALRLGPIPTRFANDRIDNDELLMGFVPGPTSPLLVEQFARRSQTADIAHPWLIGSSIDHEGTMLVPEDWLVGGEAIDSGLWGPLQSEYLLEFLVGTIQEVLLDQRIENSDPWGFYAPPTLPTRNLPRQLADPTPTAGTILEDLPADFPLPFGAAPDITTATTLRGDVVQLAWQGGDPLVDSPEVWVERLDQGAWHPLTTPAGRPMDTTRGDVVLVHHPMVDNGVTQHLWWAGWQALSAGTDRLSLDKGPYRLRVAGHHAVGEADRWPRPTTTYEVVGRSVSLEARQFEIVVDPPGVWLSIPSLDGWRAVDPLGSGGPGPYPVRAPVSYTWAQGTQTGTGTVAPTLVEDDASYYDMGLPEPITTIYLYDAYENYASFP